MRVVYRRCWRCCRLANVFEKYSPTPACIRAKCAGTNLKVEGHKIPARSAGRKFFCVPLHFSVVPPHLRGHYNNRVGAKTSNFREIRWNNALRNTQLTKLLGGLWHAKTGCLTDQQVWFPVDFQGTFSRKFSRICSFIDIYRTGSLTPGITDHVLILFTQAIAQLKDIYRGLIVPISINPGLLQDVLLVHCEVQEFWVSQKMSRRLC